MRGQFPLLIPVRVVLPPSGCWRRFSSLFFHLHLVDSSWWTKPRRRFFKKRPIWLELLVIRILSFSQHRTVPYICHQNSFFCCDRDKPLFFFGDSKFEAVGKLQWLRILKCAREDFHRGRSQRRRFSVMRSPVPGTWTCYRRSNTLAY